MAVKVLKKVSIIVPVYNASKTVEECLFSIINQTYTNLEILIINDGSTDNSLDICKQLLEKDERIMLFDKKNEGVSKTRNYGISKTSGDYICFVDSDDFISDTYIHDFIKDIEKEKADFVSCTYAIISNKHKKKQKESDKLYIYEDISKFNLLFTKTYGFSWNKMYESKIIKENSLFFNEEISMCEDLLFNYNYLIHAKKAVYREKTNYFYRITENSLSNSLKSVKWFGILDVYKILINSQYLNNDQHNMAINKYIMSLMEARERIKFLENKHLNVHFFNLELKKYLNKKTLRKLKTNEIIKIKIFKCFPKLVFLFRRRNL